MTTHDRQRLRLLLVEDSEDDAFLLLAQLQTAYEVDCERVMDRPSMAAALDANAWDLVMADFVLPRFSAPAALQLVKERGLDLPFLVVSGRVDTSTAVEAMRAGAHDYFVKGDWDRLLPAVARELHEAGERRSRRQAEAALRAQAESFRRLVELSPDPILLQGDDDVLFANPAALSFFGATMPADLLSRSVWDLIHPDDHALVRLRRGAMAAGDLLPPVEERFVRLNGEAVPVEVSAAPVTFEDRPAVQVIFRDITRRKAAAAEVARLNQALHQRIDELQTLLEILPIGICVAHDPSGRDMSINAAGARMLGVAAEANPSMTGPEAERLPFSVQQEGREVPAAELPMQYAAAHDVVIRNAEYDILHPDGTVVNLLEYASPLHDEAGQVRGCVGIFIDITERKHAEAAQRLLAEAGRQLAASLDYRQTLQTLATLALPQLADWCTIYLAGEEGAAAVASADRQPGRPALVEAVCQQVAVECGQAKSPVSRVLRSGAPVLVNAVDPACAAGLPDGVRQAAAGLLPHSLLAVPLPVRGQTVGVAVYALAQPGRRYTPADQQLLEELGRRAGVAIDNARLLAETQALNAELEDRVARRTAELQAANRALEQQIIERRQAEQRFRGLLEAAPDAMVIADANGRIVLVNSQAERLFGYARTELLGQPVEMLLPEANVPQHRQHRAAFAAAPRTRQMGPGYDLYGLRRDGTQIPVEVSLSPLHAEEGWLIMSAIRDITRRKQFEAELRDSREQLRRLTARLEAAREEERGRIAREVHDELGQQLTGLKMDVAWLQKRLDPAQAALLDKTRVMSALIDTVIHSVRKITTDLRPAVLDDFGLEPAIEWQLQEFEARSGITCQFATQGQPAEMAPAMATALFRVVQEALTNIARHAQASRVEVSLAWQPGQLLLEVRDNGRGITPDDLDHARSLGLLGMRERVGMLAGQLTFEGVPGQGTVVRATVPLPGVE